MSAQSNLGIKRPFSQGGTWWRTESSKGVVLRSPTPFEDSGRATFVPPTFEPCRNLALKKESSCISSLINWSLCSCVKDGPTAVEYAVMLGPGRR
jgi:hypothetical protein